MPPPYTYNIYLYTYIYIYIHVYVYVYIYIYLFIYLYLHVQIFTYTIKDPRTLKGAFLNAGELGGAVVFLMVLHTSYLKDSYSAACRQATATKYATSKLVKASVHNWYRRVLGNYPLTLGLAKTFTRQPEC